MPQISKLPNYCNGRQYKHWISVVKLKNEKGIFAIKRNNGKYIQLLVTKNGAERQLMSEDSRIMDTVDIRGVKRTYTYFKDKNDNIKGQMVAAKDSEKQAPLIAAAKWISKNCMPERLLLKLNSNHPASKIFVNAKQSSDNTDKLINAKEILIKDFEDPYIPLPKTIILKDEKGKTEAIISDSSKDNSAIIKQLGIRSDVLGWKLRVML